MVRYNTDGSLDTSFGGDGIVTTALSPREDYCFGVVVQGDGKIVVAGYSNNGIDTSLVRYNTDGSLDTSFDGDGIVITPSTAYAWGMALQADGKIVVTGEGFDGAKGNFAVLRYDPDGSLDTSFHGDGKVMTRLGLGEDFAKGVAIQPDGRIVVAGCSQNGSRRDFALVRYNTDGSLDTSFGGDGIVTTAVGSSNYTAKGVALQADGRIVVTGQVYNWGTDSDFVVVRYNPDGSLDTSFHGDGMVITPVGPSTDLASSVALQADGRIVVAGIVFNATDGDFAVLRYVGDDPTCFMGTPGDDTFTFTAGGTSHEVVVRLNGGSPTTYQYPASEDPSITFDGLGGNDSVTFNGGSGDDTAELYPDHGTLTGSNYSVSVSNVDSITANSGGGNDQAILHDGPQADTLVGSPTYAILFGPGVWLRANGFRSVVADATPDGQDVARLYDSDGNETFTAYPTYAVLTNGTSYSLRANDFAFVMAYANQGGTDAASFFDSDGNDTFTTTPTLATMAGKWRPEGASADRSYYNRAENFDSYEATSTAGADLARLTDSPTSDDQFVAEPTRATLSGSGLSSRANNFRYVVAYATGGNDTAQLKDSPGTDTFVATPAYGVMYASASAVNPAYLNRAGGFDQVEALSQSGGGDSARLYDSPGDDNFTADPTYVLLANDPGNPTAYSNKATGFRYAHASANGGGTDKAWLYDSSGNDTFDAYPTYAVLSNSTPGQAFYTRANYFDQVVATSSGGADIARFFDSALKDVFTFRAASNDAAMSGSGYLNQALHFRYVLAYATTGGDEANLYDSAGDDKFYGSGITARLYDAALAAYLVDVRSFQKVDIFGSTGTNARTIVRPIDYALTFSGTWVGDPWP